MLLITSFLLLINNTLEVTPVFKKNMESAASITINRGGTRSSKTWSILQQIDLWLKTGVWNNPQDRTKQLVLEKGLCSVIRKHSTSLNRSAYRDFEQIVFKNPNWISLVKWNKTEKSFSFQGRKVEFFGADDAQKLRSATRDIAYLCEANELTFEEFSQIDWRTNHKIVIDFNPDDDEIWINQELELKRMIETNDIDLIVSTFEDNRFLSERAKNSIRSLERTDKELWEVFGKGSYGKIQGLVYPSKIHLVKEFPKDCTDISYGLDFGFTNDPTALIKMGRYDGKLYRHELIYETGLLNNDIVSRLKQLECTDGRIYADSAEPKSIEEIKRKGFDIVSCRKGQDSIRNGISNVKQHECYVTSSSSNYIKERKSYKWAVDKNGSVTGKPVDFKNHLMDAERYGFEKWALPEQHFVRQLVSRNG